MEAKSGDGSPNLMVLASVRCLDCGSIYAKPSGGGTVRQNPGCPECGYVGWVALETRVTERRQPSRFAVGRRPRPTG